jgi:hypothetical protein
MVSRAKHLLYLCQDEQSRFLSRFSGIGMTATDIGIVKSKNMGPTIC